MFKSEIREAVLCMIHNIAFYTRKKWNSIKLVKCLHIIRFNLLDNKNKKKTKSVFSNEFENKHYLDTKCHSRPSHHIFSITFHFIVFFLVHFQWKTHFCTCWKMDAESVFKLILCCSGNVPPTRLNWNWWLLLLLIIQLIGDFAPMIIVVSLMWMMYQVIRKIPCRNWMTVWSYCV